LSLFLSSEQPPLPDPTRHYWFSSSSFYH
jgi:hypothetical protein